MLKITEKVTRYDIENLTEEDYSFLLHLFRSNRGLPPIKLAHKFLKKEDLLITYRITKEYLQEILNESN